MPEAVELSECAEGAVPNSEDAVPNSEDAVKTSFLRGRRAAVIEHDELRILQGGTYIEDAVYERLTYHKTDSVFLRIYRFHGSFLSQTIIGITIFILHMLIFFEEPSSISLTSDISRTFHRRLVIPYPTLLIIEGLCLVVLSLDCAVKIYGYGIRHIRSYRWNLLYAVALSLTFSGWVIALCFVQLSCGVWCKFRCFVRPMILLQHSSLMKKAFLCVVKAVPSILSVFLLFFIHIVLFTLISLVILPSDEGPANIETPAGYNLHFAGISLEALLNMLVLLTTANNPDIMTKAYNTNRFYAIFYIIYVAIGVHFLLSILFAVIFQKFREHFRESMRHSILRRTAALVVAFEVLSDVDEESFERFVPADRLNKVLKSLNVKPSIKKDIHEQFEIVKDQTTITWQIFFKEIFGAVRRKKKPGAKMHDRKTSNFDPLLEHRRVVKGAQTEIASPYVPSERENSLVVWFKWSVPYARLIFAHPLFVHFGSLVTLLNVFFIFGQKNPASHSSFIEKEAAAFVAVYAVEQAAVIWALGFRRYISIPLHVLDLGTLVPSVLCSICVVIVFHGFHDLPKDGEIKALLVLGGAGHIFIGLRLLRVALSMKLPNLILRTMTDLVVNLTPFLGVLACLYYIFGVLGMMLFAHKIHYQSKAVGCWRFEGNDSSIADSGLAGTQCPYGGGYHQREYWAENFDDFGSAIVLLWNLMLVNNWDIIVEAYHKATNSYWSHLYFIIWYIASVSITLSLLTAVIVENFIVRWSIFAKHERERKQRNLKERILEERRVAEQIASGVLPTPRATTRWQQGRRLRQQRMNAATLHSNPSVVNESTMTNEVPDSVIYRPTQSQPMNLFQVLDVKMPSMEEVRQHLSFSPYSPTDFALNLYNFETTYYLLASTRSLNQ